jgi:outer membrane protein assembly factor BamB
MNRRTFSILLSGTALSLSLGLHAATSPSDWPAWRGPTRDGHAAPDQNPPTTWSETENVLWKVAIPGRGHGSPTVVGDRIYLPTADSAKRTQSILCLNRADGKLVWQTEVHNSGAEYGKQSHSSAASASVTCDGNQLFINFLNSGAVYTTALDLSGKKLWQQKICDYVIHQGYAASPVVHESLVIVAADHKGGGVVTGLDRQTGKVVWSQPRPKHHNYTTPSIVKAAGRTQMVMAGGNVIASYDPLNGKVIWEIEGSTEECVTTIVTDGTRIFASGGYPKNHVIAVMADGSGKIAWQNIARVYVPSMIVKEGHLYAVLDAGIATCWKSDTGEELWKERLGGEVYSSPVMVGNRIYASNVAGKTYVYEATPKSFKLLAQNQLGDQAYASPVICGNRIYLRVATKTEPRQEYLYCIGVKK